MDENLIYKTAFEAIKESTEWGIEEDGKIYGHWVDGVMTFAGDLLNKIKEEKNGKSIEN